MNIRPETDGDRDAVFAVHDAAFAVEGRPVSPEARLVDELRRAGDTVPGLALVAEVDGTVVGHVVGSRARLGDLPSLGVGPLGIRPDRQGQGIGSALVRAVIDAAEALEFPEIVILGDPAYYRRFGFRLAAPLGIEPPDPAWVEHFQVLPLRRWSAGRRGTFAYAPAFALV